MANNEDRLSASLHDTKELEAFLHTFLAAVAKRKPKSGEDVTRYASELGLKIPALLEGAEITWTREDDVDETAKANGDQTLVLAQPCHANALGLTIGCIKVRRWKICLECGWLYCRIVIKGTF